MFAGSSHASDADGSRAAYRRGVQQFEQGNYVAARDSFLEAYNLYPDPSIFLNLGIARFWTHEYLDAEQNLARFLEEDTRAPPNEVASARTALRDVRAHLGTFRLRVSPAASIAQLDDRPIGLIPGKFVDVRTTLGAHALHVQADGFAPRDESIHVAAGDPSPVDLTLAPSSDPKAPDAAPTSTRAIVGWTLVATGVATAGFATFAGFRASSLANGYNTPNSGSFQDASAKSSGITFRTLADVCFGGALVATGVGIYLLLTPSSVPSAQQASFVVGPAFTGIAGKF